MKKLLIIVATLWMGSAMAESQIYAEETLLVGTETIVSSNSPSKTYQVVFEDDKETGYFYGLDTSIKGNSIVDALHIYNVSSVTDKEKPSKVQIVWSGDGNKALLLINRYPHAAFDFTAKRGYCRTGFPPPSKNWSSEGHDWDDKVLGLFE